MADDLLEVLEAGYRLDGDDRQWLDRVARAVQKQIDPRRVGVISFLYELSSAGKVTPSNLLSYDVPEPFATICGSIPTGLPPWYVRQTFAQHPCASAVNTGTARARALSRMSMKQAFSSIGWRDLLVINGLDPTGQGVYVAAARKGARPLPRPFVARWTRVAVHLASAWRLRRTLRDATARHVDSAEAVLGPDGRLAHARDQARAREARQSLVRAARAIEGARTRRGRRNADRAVAEWTGLIAARWSLVDHFDSDGKRWLLAR
ncbi:MAG: hypothetical protein ACXVAN_18075, partial [Polyangia bacterium]